MSVPTVPTAPAAPTEIRDAECTGARYTEYSGWEVPVALDTGAVPPFPVSALPDVFRDYVSALAAFAEVPPDLPGILTLGVTAAAIARKVRIQVRDGYSEPLNIFAAVAMPSGTRKTAVFSHVTAPLVEYERELLDRMGPEIAEAQSRARVQDKALQQVERKVTAGSKDAAKWDNARRDLARLVREREIPAQPRILMADCTPEAVAQGLSEQGGRLAVFSPEGDVFALLKRYAKDGAANFEIYLKAHAGDELRVDRRHAPPVTVPTPALTVAVCVQPDVLQGLARDRVFRERGLLARFLYAVPRSIIGKRTFDGQAVSAAVRQRYNDSVSWLCRSSAQAAPLALSPDAFERWRSFALEVEQERPAGGRFAQLLDWSGKLPGLVARLAGILHAGQGAEVQRLGPTVEADTMGAAVELGEYAAAHALAAFGMMGADPALADARVLLDWLTRARVPTFSTRDSYRENRGMTPPAARLALAELAERGWIRLVLDARRNGRPSERWAVHPHLGDPPA